MLQPQPFQTFNMTPHNHTHLPRRPDSGTVTASLYSPSGNYLGVAAVTIDNATSSVNAAANVGALTLNIGSATNFRVGHRYVVGNSDPDDYTAEKVTVKSKSNNTITLLRPMLFDHASGDPIGGSQIDITVTGSYNNVIGDGYRIHVDYHVSGSAQPTIVESYDVVRYEPISRLNEETMRDLDPTLTKKLPSGIAFEELRTRTWAMIVQRIKAQYSAGSLVSSGDLTTAHSYMVRMVIAEAAGPDYLEYRTLMAQRFEEEFKVALAAATMDHEQDGATDGPLDKFRTQIKLVRR